MISIQTILLRAYRLLFAEKSDPFRGRDPFRPNLSSRLAWQDKLVKLAN